MPSAFRLHNTSKLAMPLHSSHAYSHPEQRTLFPNHSRKQTLRNTYQVRLLPSSRAGIRGPKWASPTLEWLSLRVIKPGQEAGSGKIQSGKGQLQPKLE
jgi:hypothetical protein